MFFLLAIIQGLCEFLPVSSSAHLWLLPWLLKSPYQGLAIDVVFHFATLIAVILYFRKEILLILLRFWQKPFPLYKTELGLLVLATLPAGLIGLFFQNKIENLLRSPFLIAFNSAFFALVLLYAHKRLSSEKSLDFKKSLLIGIAQVLSLAPGVSRSGITYSAGRLLGLPALEAFRFSMLLSVPTILGASIVEAPRLIQEGEMRATLFPFLLAFLVGLLAIALFQRLIKSKRGILLLSLYRFLLAAVIVLVALKR